MKKKNTVLGLLTAGALLVSGAALSHAGDLKITGFADIQYYISNDQPTIDKATGKNIVENQFVVKGEIDFEKEVENVTFRMDLDFPSGETGPKTIGRTLADTNMSVTGMPAGSASFADNIEQLKFVLALTGKEAGNLSLTGGIFNSPIGYELQDAPDRNFISFGQLRSMVPFNLGGVRLAASHGPVSASVLYTDEWRSVAAAKDSGNPGAVTVGNWTLPTSEENSFGGTLAFNPMPEVGLSIGYLFSTTL